MRYPYFSAEKQGSSSGSERVLHFSEEKKLWKRGFKRVVGLDEAGRGPLAGPVTAAAVFINQKFKTQNKKIQTKSQKLFYQVKDSKKLSAKKREEIFKILIKHPAVKWGIGVVSESVIDKINIKNAAELAMQIALEKLEKKIGKKADFLIIDGNNIKNYKLKTTNHKLIVGADEKVFSCSAASILAKVWRDRIMKRYHKKYPEYGFDRHKGYPTKFHREKIGFFGHCVIHRRTFLTKICVVE